MELEYTMYRQNIGPLQFRNTKILNNWIEVITERGAQNIKVNGKLISIEDKIDNKTKAAGKD